MRCYGRLPLGNGGRIAHSSRRIVARAKLELCSPDLLHGFAAVTRRGFFCGGADRHDDFRPTDRAAEVFFCGDYVVGIRSVWFDGQHADGSAEDLPDNPGQNQADDELRHDGAISVPVSHHCETCSDGHDATKEIDVLQREDIPNNDRDCATG